MAEEIVSIKRYPNRRFYDRQRREYVTLQDIETLVREGKTVEVIDSQTGEDITRNILTQIILEKHPDKMALFPSPMLHAILRANDLMSDWFRGYFRQAMGMWESFQASRSPSANPMDWMRLMFPSSPLSPRGWPAPESSARPTSSDSAEHSSGDVESEQASPDRETEEARRESWMKRLAELEARIHQLEASPEKPARKRKPPR